MKQALIVTGGYCNTGHIVLDTDLFFLKIAADSGYLTARKLGILPDILIGDFDSLDEPLPDNIPIIRAPAQKDETDTMLACMTAIKHGANKILILGGTGGRIDHLFSNVFYLDYLRENKIKARLTDGENTVRIIADETVKLKQNNGYFSVFALLPSVVTLTGCKYPLADASLSPSYPYAVSNEIIGDFADITICGKALLCESTKL